MIDAELLEMIRLVMSSPYIATTQAGSLVF